MDQIAGAGVFVFLFARIPSQKLRYRFMWTRLLRATARAWLAAGCWLLLYDLCFVLFCLLICWMVRVEGCLDGVFCLFDFCWGSGACLDFGVVGLGVPQLATGGGLCAVSFSAEKG